MTSIYTVGNLKLSTSNIETINSNNLNLLPNNTGQVLLKSDPTSALGAATKQYVDTFTPSTTSTLTNKTINASNNSLSNITNTNISSTAAIDATKISSGLVSNTEFSYLDGVTSSIQTQLNQVSNTSVQILSNKTLNDANCSFFDNTDPTNKISFNVNGSSSNHIAIIASKSTGTGQDTFNLPDLNANTDEFCLLNATQVITNKDITATNFTSGNINILTNTISSTEENSNINIIPDGSGEVIVNSNPTSNLAVATKQYVDLFTPTTTNTLTNKTIDASNNSLTNISNSNISTTANIDASKITNANITNVEFSYLTGLTSNIQNQINATTSSATQTLTNKTIISSNSTFGNLNLTANTLSSTDLNSNIIFTPSGSGEVLVKADPVSSLGVATKSYVDSVAVGFHIIAPVRVKTTTSLPSYIKTGMTITSSSNQELPTIDSVSLATNDRILIDSLGSTNSVHNGVYIVTQLGSISTPFILTRASDANTNSEVVTGQFVVINEGTINQFTSYILTTSGSIIVDTTSLVYTKLNTNTESPYLAGVTSNIQTQFNNLSNTATQTLSNKTISATNNSLTNIANANIISGANIDVSKLGTGVINNTVFNYLTGLTSNIQDQLISTSSVGGSNKQVQYNNNSSFAGASNLTIDTDGYAIIGSSTTQPSVIQTTNTKLFSKFRAGRYTLTQLNPTLNASRDISLQTSLITQKVCLWTANGNSTTTSAIGLTVSATGTATSRTVTTTNLFSSLKRLGYVSAATVGSSAGLRQSTLQYHRGNVTSLGGFYYSCKFGLSSASSVATQRTFVGFTNLTTALTNVEPSTNANILGFAVDSQDTAWSFIHSSALSVLTGSISGTTLTITSVTSGALYVNQIITGSNILANTKIISFISSTGGTGTYLISLTQTVASTTISGCAIKEATLSSFPARDLSTTIFETRIYCPSNSTTIYYSIEALNSNIIYENSVSSLIPVNTLLMAPQVWTNNATTALAVGIDIVSQYLETDY
jgi:hypothetical protein